MIRNPQNNVGTYLGPDSNLKVCRTLRPELLPETSGVGFRVLGLGLGMEGLNVAIRR